MTRNFKKIEQKNVAIIISIVIMLLKAPKGNKWSEFFTPDEVENLTKILNALSHRMDAVLSKAVNDSAIVVPFVIHLLNWNCPVYWNEPEKTIHIIVNVLEFIGNCVSVDSIETVQNFINH